MTNNLLETIKKQKWIIIIIISIILLVLLHYFDISSTFEHNTDTPAINARTSRSTNSSIRTLSDYYTGKLDTNIKIISLKCRLNTEDPKKDYYLGNIKKEKIGENCNHCSVSDVSDSKLVLVHKKNIVQKNCNVDEKYKCYNDHSGNTEMINCNTYANNMCNSKKINSKFLEFILDDNDGEMDDFSKRSFSLKSMNLEGQIMSIIQGLVCTKKAVSVLDENQKIYLDKHDNEYHFKIYFKTEDGNKYLKVCGEDKCDNTLCEDYIKKDEKFVATGGCIDNFKNNFKYLCLGDISDKDVLIFEPVLIRHDKIE